MKTNFKLRVFSILVLLFAFAGTINAQVVYKVDSKYDADIKVYVASSKYDADLVVYEVSSKYDADKDGLWFFCDSKYDAKKKVYFVDSKYDADLIIFFADSKYDAGWVNNSKQHLLK
ncbi:MAG: hypothetical protein A2W91_09525 [Bacteroidetes bacterium GWF2_38_335]|nr:MAG: hypothetical protein A2W91_09525 [Bacteroidetes bacterium GWF2_38_335]